VNAPVVGSTQKGFVQMIPEILGSAPLVGLVRHFMSTPENVPTSNAISGLLFPNGSVDLSSPVIE
jgi:hypothetical protein